MKVSADCSFESTQLEIFSVRPIMHIFLPLSIVVLAGALIRPISSSLERAFNEYDNSCSCGFRYENNCAHFLSNALIKGGFSQLDGGIGSNFRKRNGMIVCRTGRPVRANELRAWFREFYGGWHRTPRVGVNFVYQQRVSDGQGHVLLKDYTREMVNKYPTASKGQNVKGTADFDGVDGWIQEFYYPTTSSVCYNA